MGIDGIVGVSGCRLSDGRLHLGHYLGCFHPQKLRHVSQSFFVIQDQETNRFAGALPSKNSLAMLLAQFYSLPMQHEAIPCLQSAIFPAYAPLYDFARDAMTLRTLETVHPKKDDLRSTNALALRSYLFPVDQAVQFLAFGAEFALMNDDNLRFVNLARKLHKKLVAHDQIPAPTLLMEPCPRLLGSDGKKMAKAHANCIFLTDDDRTIVEQLKNYARRLGWRWTKDSMWHFEGTVDLSEKLALDSPLSTMFLAFGDPTAAPNMHVGDVPEMIKVLVAAILPLISEVRARALDALNSQETLWDRFQSDSARAAQRIYATLERLAP